MIAISAAAVSGASAVLSGINLMWASTTNYSALYTSEYFGKKTGIASFDTQKLPHLIGALGQEIGCPTIVDIGSGSGILSEKLTEIGINVLSCDFDPVSPEFVHFDLSSSDPELLASTKSEISRRLGISNYLLSCLDVLEHIDIDDVAACVYNLKQVTSDWALVSISTRPSSRDNAYHSTVLPLSTWQKILEIAGFDLARSGLFKETQHIVNPDSPDQNILLVSQWAKADPFKDRLDGEPRYLLLRAAREACYADIKTSIDALLDIDYRHEKRQKFGTLAENVRVGLNIHHIQDFLNIRPLMDVLYGRNTVGFVRPYTLRPDELSLVRGFFRRCGVRLIEFERTHDIDWAALKVDFLVSAAESSVSVSHALSKMLVDSAKLNGVRTVMLQHGIWTEKFFDRIVSSSSDILVTWGSEHKGFLDSPHMLAGTAIATGAVGEVREFGGPKFADIAIAPGSNVIQNRLGVDLSGFRRVALVGTNLHWPAHGFDARTTKEALGDLIKANPDIFFVVKPHPAERAAQYD